MTENHYVWISVNFGTAFFLTLSNFHTKCHRNTIIASYFIRYVKNTCHLKQLITIAEICHKTVLNFPEICHRFILNVDMLACGFSYKSVHPNWVRPETYVNLLQLLQGLEKP